MLSHIRLPTQVRASVAHTLRSQPLSLPSIGLLHIFKSTRSLSRRHTLSIDLHHSFQPYCRGSQPSPNTWLSTETPKKACTRPPFELTSTLIGMKVVFLKQRPPNAIMLKNGACFYHRGCSAHLSRPSVSFWKNKLCTI